MTFSYDMSLDTGYEKPTYPGTGNGLGGEGLQDEYDVVVIGSGMGGLACGALSAEYGSRVAVIESHIKPGGSAHTFTRVHKGGKYSFEVGPSIFEGLNGPSLNPLRTILDMLGEAPLRTWAPGQGHAQTLSRCRPETSGTPAFGSSVPAAPLPTAAIFQPLPFDRPRPHRRRRRHRRRRPPRRHHRGHHHRHSPPPPPLPSPPPPSPPPSPPPLLPRGLLPLSFSSVPATLPASSSVAPACCAPGEECSSGVALPSAAGPQVRDVQRARVLDARRARAETPREYPRLQSPGEHARPTLPPAPPAPRRSRDAKALRPKVFNRFPFAACRRPPPPRAGWRCKPSLPPPSQRDTGASRSARPKSSRTWSMRGAGPSRARRRRRGVGCSQVHVRDPSTNFPRPFHRRWTSGTRCASASSRSALCTSCSVPAHTRLGPRPPSRRRLKTLGGSTTAVSLADATPGPALAVDSVSPRVGL